MRGNLYNMNFIANLIGSIPASAGEPRTFGDAPRQRPVYPRECGEPIFVRDTGCNCPVYPRECGGTGGAAAAGNVRLGLSPRVRGNLDYVGGMGAHERSIPASAGEPPATSTRPPPLTVYPRECGGTRSSLTLGRPLRGLSPRVRGNPSRARTSVNNSGSIPASAGEPSRGPASAS